jgi:hypothetical protein
MSFIQQSHADFSLSRFAGLGSLTVFASIGVVLLIRAVSVTLLHPAPTFVPLGVFPPILDTAILVTWAVVVFGVMLRFVSDAIRKFKMLAGAFLLLSFLPDLALLKWHVWGATLGYVLVLVLMHIGAWATCVTILTSFPPRLGGSLAHSKPSNLPLRILLIPLVAGIATLPMEWKAKIAVLFVITICGAYGVLFTRLRNRRVGSAAVGAFYDMLEQDRRRAVEIVVDAKAEQQLPEDAEGGPDLK